MATQQFTVDSTPSQFQVEAEEDSPVTSTPSSVEDGSVTAGQKFKIIQDMVMEEASRIPEGFKDEQTQRGMGSIAGGIIGGVIGSPLPGGALVGGALGSMAGNQFVGAFQQATNNTVLEPNELLTETVVDGLIDIGMFGMASAVGNKFLTKGFKRLFTVDKEIQNVAKQAERAGLDLSISDVSRLGSGAKTILGVFPIIGIPFTKHADTLNKKAFQNLTGQLDDLAPTGLFSSAGADMVASARQNYKKFGKVSEGLYKHFYNLADTISVPDIVPTRFAKGVLSTRRIPPEIVTTGGRQIPRKAGASEVEQFLADISDLPPNISPSQNRRLIEDISEFFKEGKATGEQGRILTEIRKSLDEGFMNMDVSKLPPGEGEAISTAYRDANDFFSENIVTFRNATAKKFEAVDKKIFKIGGKEAGSIGEEELAQKIFNTKSIESLRDLRNLIGDDSMKLAAKTWYGDAITRSMTIDPSSKHVVFNARKLANELLIDTKPRYIQEMFKGSGIDSQLITDTLQSLSHMGETVFPAKMVARRFILGGIESAKGAFLGGPLRAAGRGVAGAAGFASTGGLIMLAYYGSKLLSNPPVLKALATATSDGPVKLQSRMAALNLLETYVRLNPERGPNSSP